MLGLYSTMLTRAATLRRCCLTRPQRISSTFQRAIPAYSSKVARYAVVGIVAPHHRGQMGALVRDRLMPVAPTPVRNRRQRAGVTVLCRYLPHHFLACPRLAPDVGEAEEGERGTIRLRMVSPIWSVVAEIDELGRNICASTRPVLDDEWLAEPPIDLLGAR